MDLLGIIKAGEAWVVESRNAWTGITAAKKFATKEAAFAWIKARESEKKILARKARPPHEDITVYSLMRRYFDRVLRNKITISRSGYHAVSVVEAFGHRLAKTIDIQDFHNFMEVQRARGIAQTTANVRAGILRTAINWGVAQGLLSFNQLSGLRFPPASPQEISPPTPEELKAMLRAAPKHIAKIIYIGLHTGARVGPSELFRLRWKDIDFKTRIIRLPCASKNPNIRVREVPIKDSLVSMLEDWHREDVSAGVEWVIHRGGNPIRSASTAWRKALARAEITRRIRPYDLRHAYATYALAGGADVKSVAEVMGHADASMILKVYQHVRPEQKKMAVEAVPDLF